MFVYWLYDMKVHSLPQTEGYIGITNDFASRVRQHRVRRKGLGRIYDFQADVLFEGTKKECRALEYGLRPRSGIGWNSHPGGMIGFQGRHTEETKDLIRKKRALQAPLSAESRAKVSLSLLGNKRTFGKKTSAETRAKQSASVHKAIAEGRYHHGHKTSPETKAKMRAARLAYLASHPEERERLKQPRPNRRKQCRGSC